MSTWHGDLEPLTTYLDPRTADRVRDLAAASSRSIAGEIRHALQTHLTKSESPAAKPSSQDNPGAGTAENAAPEA